MDTPFQSLLGIIQFSILSIPQQRTLLSVLSSIPFSTSNNYLTSAFDMLLISLYPTNLTVQHPGKFKLQTHNIQMGPVCECYIPAPVYCHPLSNLYITNPKILKLLHLFPSLHSTRSLHEASSHLFQKLIFTSLPHSSAKMFFFLHDYQLFLYNVN